MPPPWVTQMFRNRFLTVSASIRDQLMHLAVAGFVYMTLTRFLLVAQTGVVASELGDPGLNSEQRVITPLSHMYRRLIDLWWLFRHVLGTVECRGNAFLDYERSGEIDWSNFPPGDNAYLHYDWATGEVSSVTSRRRDVRYGASGPSEGAPIARIDVTWITLQDRRVKLAGCGSLLADFYMDGGSSE